MIKKLGQYAQKSQKCSISVKYIGPSKIKAWT